MKVVIELGHVLFHVEVIELWCGSLGKLFEKGEEVDLRVCGEERVDFVGCGFFEIGITGK